MPQDPIFAKFDQVLGKTTPTVAGAPTQSRAAEIRALGQQHSQPEQSTAPEDTLGTATARETLAGAEKMKNSITEGADKFAKSPDIQKGDTVTQAVQKEAGKTGALLEAGLGTAAGATRSVLAPLTAILGKALSHGTDTNTAHTSQISNPGSDPISQWAQQHPEAAKNLQDALTVVGGATADIGGSANPLNTDLGAMAKEAPETFGGAAKTLENAQQYGVKPSVDPEKSIAKITDAISPKMTAKETKLALDKGRIVPGQDPSLLKSGTPDTVLPSDETAKAAKVIHDNIPGAMDMKPPELYKALDDNISETATQLRPKMEATPIGEDTITKINADWKVLKAQQIETANATDEANIAKWQGQFEKYLQKSGSNNLADLWDARVKYDSSIPSRVKEATSQSPENLQTQKEIWLQNRRILNDAIHGASSGLGDSKGAFADMSAMYNAQKGIKSSFKLSTEGAPSKLGQAAEAIKKHPIMAGVAGYEALKHTVAPALPGF